MYNIYIFTEPKWASINRGVLLCDDCANIHLTLGRHISQVCKKTFIPLHLINKIVNQI